MSLRNDAGDIAKGTVIALVVGTIAIVAVIALSLMAVFGAAWFSKTTANTRGKTDVRERTVADGQYRIAAYDHFYDACAGIQGFEAQIKSIEQQIAAKPAPGPTELAQLQTFLATNRAQRITAIQQYNADARKAGTLGQFRASDLPFSIDPTEESTTC